MHIGKGASEYLAYVLGKFSSGELSDQERHAAFMLLCTLPDNACIKDFIGAASQEQIEGAGLPGSVAVALAPLLVRLELNLPYAGRFASLFESGTGMADVPISLQ
jgi:hypothetical protein